MILYIIKSILCSTLLILLYRLILEKEKIHIFNRFYLLAAMLLSIIIPAITVEIAQSATDALVNFSRIIPVSQTIDTQATQVVNTVAESPEFDWPLLLIVLYSVITTLLLFRFLNNLLGILTALNGKKIIPYRNAFLVTDEKTAVPYTFIKYIFVNTKDSENHQILTHELTHTHQKHTLDILFIELMHCLMWFNPALFLYKKAIRLNHEFLADEKVVKNYSVDEYQQLLLGKCQMQSITSLTSSLNYSVTKKRFIMMTTLKNETRSAFKIMIACVIIVGATILFIEKTYAQTGSAATDSIGRTATDHISTDSSLVYFDCVYNKIKQKQVLKSGKERVIYNLTGITDECKAHLLSIYNSMTPEQKEKYPETVALFTPMPPPEKKSPTSEQLMAWSDPAIYGVWLDGKRISNSELEKYKPTDIAHVFMSRLMKNAAHYGQYKFHVDLMTHPYFDISYPPKSE